MKEEETNSIAWYTYPGASVNTEKPFTALYIRPESRLTRVVDRPGGHVC